MMKFPVSLWSRVRKGRILPDSRLKGEDSSIRAYITQVVLKLLAGALALFTTIIIFAWWAGRLEYDGPAIIAVVDVPFVIGMWLVRRGRWQAASYLPPVTFFLLALKVNYDGGLFTTAIILYAISILLAGMLQGNRAQFLILGFSILAYSLFAVLQPRDVVDDILPPLITVSGCLVGIALLQWLSNSQFRQALAQAYAAARELEQRSTELAKSNQDLQGQISARIEAQNALQEAERMLSTLMGNLPGMAYRCRYDQDWTMEFVSEGCIPLTGYQPADLILTHKISYKQIIHEDDRELVSQGVEDGLHSGTPFELVYRIKTSAGEIRWVWEKGRGILSPTQEVLAIEGFITDVSDQIQKEIELESLADISLTLRTALTVEEMLPDLLRKTVAAFGACIGSIYLLDQETGDLIAQAWYPTVPQLHGHRLSVGASIAGQIATAGNIHITENMAEDPWSYLLPYDCGLESTIRTGISLPLRTNEYIVGVMHFGLPESPSAVNERMHLATTVADMVALAIWRANLFEETQRRFEHLLVLRKIDRTITSTMELRPILEVLLDQIAAHLHVDAATILLLSPVTQTLDTAARRGFNTPALLHTHLPLGEGFAGRAALERQVIHIGDLTQAGGDLSQASLFIQEGFASYFAFPLVAKGQVKGVLELFLRLPFAPDQEWLDFLDALATQAAIAIDNVELFESMQSANYQLAKAYEATIEGWSKALELRDQETEGHSQRVTEMTLRLARDMGVRDEELVHIRRGALLHDIGKMAIPDHILLKPGPLTEDEWVIMRGHPVHAYELLSPIAYLRPALDIPYCHHEKWDGSGYPRGLKGGQIPLCARIFAVVDVWDALSSDRPYRKAWDDQKIVDYFRKETGKHFDPEVVKVFFSYFDQPKSVISLDLKTPRLPSRPYKH
jgi:putative nucleotidyltransferase with HDIG domain